MKNVYWSHQCLKTYQHVLEVEKEAIKLACKYNVDIEKCKTVALLHDISAIMSPNDMYEEIIKRGMIKLFF